MDLPQNSSLPFFAYGTFKPGELAFLRIRRFVESYSEVFVPGPMKIRDGMPIACPPESGSRKIVGSLLTFREGSGVEAYQGIVDLEPGKQYRWSITDVEGREANYLLARSPDKGSQSLDGPSDFNEDGNFIWSGKHDPIFTTALDVVEETMDSNRRFEWDLKPLFRLESAYLLLWCAIERYASFRYNLSADRATDKVLQIAEEPAFVASLRSHVGESEDGSARIVYRADRPTERCALDPEDPKKALEYYQQIRHNLVHRGKGNPRDHERLKKSLEELLSIFRETLNTAFEESAAALGSD